MVFVSSFDLSMRFLFILSEISQVKYAVYFYEKLKFRR